MKIIKRGEKEMKPLKIKDRCTKKSLSKCKGVVRLYDKIQIAYAERLEHDGSIVLKYEKSNTMGLFCCSGIKLFPTQP